MEHPNSCFPHFGGSGFTPTMYIFKDFILLFEERYKTTEEEHHLILLFEERWNLREDRSQRYCCFLPNPYLQYILEVLNSMIKFLRHNG